MSHLSRRDFLKLSGGAAAALAASAAPVLGQKRIALPGSDTRAKSWQITGQQVPDLAAFDDTLLDFMQPRDIRYGAVAVTQNQRLVLARAYSYSSPAKAIIPQTLFRIASISKPFTAVATLRLVQDGQLSLDAKLTDLLDLQALPGETPDSRLGDITVLNLLQHHGGWNRDVSGDPMFNDFAIAALNGVDLPVNRQHIMNYVTGLPLDFDPGTQYAYSNYGYLLLGEIIQAVSGMTYKQYVKEKIFKPLGIQKMKPGKTVKEKRRLNEVTYRSQYKGTTVQDNSGVPVKAPYGAWRLENMLAHGGWLASAPHLVKFASAFDNPASSPLLNQAMIDTMFAVPATGTDGSGAWYGCGWAVRTAGSGLNTWHFGSLDGTYTGLIRRSDGLNWAMVFNQRDDPSGLDYGDIDWMMHVAADSVTSWPTHDLFSQYL